MINDSTRFQASEWQSRPLCRRYLLLHVQPLSVPVLEEGFERNQTVRWGLGVLADGQYEVLGMRSLPASGATGWHELFEDLRIRGVESVRFVASNEPMEVSATLRAAYPDATVLPAMGQLLRQSLAQVAPRHRNAGAEALGGLCSAGTAQAARAALTALAASPWGASNVAVVEHWSAAVERLAPFYALATRLRRLILSGDEAAERVGRTLQRAVARSGNFPSETAAVAFTSEVLDRVDRGHYTARPLLVRGAGNRVRSLSGRAALADCR